MVPLRRDLFDTDDATLHGGEDRLRHILDKYGVASVVDDPEAYIGRAVQGEQESNRLDGFAETHVVGQNTTGADVVYESEPR